MAGNGAGSSEYESETNTLVSLQGWELAGSPAQGQHGTSAMAMLKGDGLG